MPKSGAPRSLIRLQLCFGFELSPDLLAATFILQCMSQVSAEGGIRRIASCRRFK